ncbi:MAG TPA: asparagine synthase-related protein [Candidatus Acidoferrum sp.]
MSGICGICEPGIEVSRARLDEMLAACSLPEESGSEGLTGNSAALGVSRRWPYQQAGKFRGVRIALDADLHNLDELSTFLKTQGLAAGQLPLAETIASLYRILGPSFVERLQGAFAIAIWDESLRQLLLAVDRFGFKTLYWRSERERFVFASRVGAVRVGQESAAEINPEAITQFLLFSVVPAPLSIFKGVERLSPGFLLTFLNGEVKTKRYWDLAYAEDQSRDEGYWARELQEEMRGAVHRHLEGCDPQKTGSYLSGGTDSSSVAAFMSERLTPAKTFSISFPLEGYNEIEFARTVAKKFQTSHYERCLSPEDAVTAIPKLIGYYDEPFANSSAIASYHCALVARESGMDTLFAGDGGDELFGGNARYADDKKFALYQSVPSWLRRGLIEPVARLLPAADGKLSLPRRYIRRAQIPNPRRIMSYNFFLNMEAREVFEPDFVSQASENGFLAIAEEHFRSAHASSELNRLLYMDVKMTLADNDLRKVNGTAELAGVRVRYPLLDTRLAEFSGRIPTNLKLKGMEKRYIFKQAMKGILPDQVLYKKKHGFGVPLGEWFLHDSNLKSLVQDVLGDPRTQQRGYFRREFLQKLIGLHQQENAGFYGEIIWYLVALELWHREHLKPVREVSIAG